MIFQLEYTYDQPLSQHFQYYDVERAFENLCRTYVFNYRRKQTLRFVCKVISRPIKVTQMLQSRYRY